MSTPRAAVDEVDLPVAGEDPVVALAAGAVAVAPRVELVTAGAPAQHVGPRAAEEPVGAAAADQRVLAALALEHVGLRSADQAVGTARADEVPGLRDAGEGQRSDQQ